MYTASSKLSDSDENGVYSDWERHKLAVLGLRRLSQVWAVCALAVLGLVVATGPLRGAGAALGIGALVSAIGACVAVFVNVTRRGVDLRAPMGGAAWLCAWLALCGGVAVALSGGWDTPFAFGLLPAALAWPLFMPGGVRRALPALGGALALHLVALFAGSSEAPGAHGAALILIWTAMIAAAIGASDVVELWRRRAAAASRVDWLTGALTPMEMRERLDVLVSVRGREMAPFSIVLFDIDRFQTVNHLYGRAAGDEMLEMVAGAIRAEVRGGDYVSRWGGDEFLVVLDNCELARASSMIERTRRRLANTSITLRTGVVKASIAAGVVESPLGEPSTTKDLIKQVEHALESSKESARNRTSYGAGGAPPNPPAQAVTVQDDPTAVLTDPGVLAEMLGEPN